jgi:hypothetical protein
MKQIQVESTNYIYFTRCDELPNTRVMNAKVEGTPNQEIWENLLKQV